MAEIELHPDFKDFLRLLNSRREVIEIDGIPVNFISFEDPKDNKRASDRHKDLENLEHLP